MIRRVIYSLLFGSASSLECSPSVGAIDWPRPLYASSNCILEMPTSRLPTSPPWEVRSRLLRHIISEASCERVQKTLKSVVSLWNVWNNVFPLDFTVYHIR